MLRLAFGTEAPASFEWPKSSTGWMLEPLLAFITKHNLIEAIVDGCSLGVVIALGEPVLKQ